MLFMPAEEQLHRIEVSDIFPRDYVEHVKLSADALRERLPFEPPFDVVIVGGSGLVGIANQLDFQEGMLVEIPEGEVGFPTGPRVEGHTDIMVAGVTKLGKKVLVRSRGVHPYNIPTLGLNSLIGRLSQSTVATMNLHIFAELGGSRDIVLSCACGGIANPVWPGEPPLFAKIPETTVIASDFNSAYLSNLQGPYQGLGDNVRFPASRESDKEIKDRYKASWRRIYGTQVAEHVYWTSASTSGYENRAHIRFALQNLWRLVGMSFSAEAERLSTLRQAFPNMLALGVATNPLLLMMKDGNVPLLEVKKRLGVSLTEFDTSLLERGLPLIPSKYEIDFIPATELKIEFPADHEDVKRAGGVAVTELAPVLRDFINI